MAPCEKPPDKSAEIPLDKKNIFSKKVYKIALKSSLKYQKYFSDENNIHKRGLSKVKIIN